MNNLSILLSNNTRNFKILFTKVPVVIFFEKSATRKKTQRNNFVSLQISFFQLEKLIFYNFSLDRFRQTDPSWQNKIFKKFQTKKTFPKRRHFHTKYSYLMDVYAYLSLLMTAIFCCAAYSWMQMSRGGAATRGKGLLVGVFSASRSCRGVTLIRLYLRNTTLRRWYKYLNSF